MIASDTTTTTTTAGVQTQAAAAGQRPRSTRRTRNSGPYPSNTPAQSLERTKEALVGMLSNHSAEDLTPFVFHMYHGTRADGRSHEDALRITSIAYDIPNEGVLYHMECYEKECM